MRDCRSDVRARTKRVAHKVGRVLGVTRRSAGASLSAANCRGSATSTTPPVVDEATAAVIRWSASSWVVRRSAASGPAASGLRKSTASGWSRSGTRHSRCDGRFGDELGKTGALLFQVVLEWSMARDYDGVRVTRCVHWARRRRAYASSGARCVQKRFHAGRLVSRESIGRHGEGEGALRVSFAEVHGNGDSPHAV